MLRAILKYRHGSLPQSKLSRELAKQAVITKCRGLSMREPSRVFIKIKPWISVPKRKSVIIKISLILKNLWKSVIICGQKRSPWRKKMSVDEIRGDKGRDKSQ